MTISSTVSRNDYISGALTYSYSFPVQLDSHIQVTVRDDDGVETTLVLTTDYTVTGAGTSSGTIVLVDTGQAWITASALTSGYTLTIRRVVPLTQLTDIRNQGPYYASVHEDKFDLLAAADIQQQDQLDRSLSLPGTEDPADYSMVLPAEANRASKVLGFDVDGNATAIANVPTSGVTATAFAETLLDDANAGAARATLGFGASGLFLVAGDIASDAVTTAKILDANVTTAKLSETTRGNLGLYAAPSSGANAYVIAPSPAFTAYATGMGVVFKADFENTSSTTLAVSGLTAKALVDREGAALVGGEIKVGMMVRAYYDGTSFVCPDILAFAEVWAYTGNGFGSTNTKIRRFTTSTSTGTAITYADSGTNGATFTVNKAGTYMVSAQDVGGTHDWGISVNSNQLTTSISSITASHRKAYTLSGGTQNLTTVACMNLASGDVVRAHSNGATTSGDANASLRITRVG